MEPSNADLAAFKSSIRADVIAEGYVGEEIEEEVNLRYEDRVDDFVYEFDADMREISGRDE